MGRTSRGLAAFVAAGLAFAGMAPAALAQEESGTAASPHGPTGRTGGLRCESAPQWDPGAEDE